MKKFIVFSVLIAAMSILIAPKAGAVIIDSVTVKPTGEAKAKCSGNLPVAMDASISGATKPNNNGDGTFKVNLSWKSCNGKADTRAYAVTGNKEICPKTGSYGLSGSAYDCVKYIGNPPYSGASSLSCGNKRNGDCIEPGFKNRGVLKEANKPDADNSKSIAMSYHIDDWKKSKQFRDGSETVASGELCQYYKTGSPYFGTNNTRKGCINVSVKVKWTAEWTLKPTTQFRVLRANNSLNWAARSDIPKVSIGDKVEWRYQVENSEAGTATFKRQGAYKSAPASQIGATPWTYGTPSGNTTLAGNKTATYNGPAPYTIRVSDAGKIICRTWGVDPSNESDNNRNFYFGGSQGCVEVISTPYELTPEITPAGQLVDIGSTVSITGIVRNTAGVSVPTTWQLNRTVIDKDTPLPTNLIATSTSDNTTDPCRWYGGNCQLVASGNNTVFTQPSTTVSELPNQALDEPIGTKICWVLSVKPPNPQPENNATWRHSIPSCFIVAKKPKVHVLGSDIRVRGKIRTSTSVLNVTTLYGSWSEFAGMSTDDNIAAGSGAALRQGNSSQTQSAWSDLTFANVKPAAATNHEFGNLDSLPELPDVEAYFKNQTASPVSGSIVLPNAAGTTILKASGDLRVSGTVKGTVVILADGDVRITGSGIRYDATGAKKGSDLPQVIIVANTIGIDQSVEQVDAWLIARSSINTCADVVNNVTSPALTAGMCNKPLTINGPVATEKLYLFRTAGSDIDTPADAAEVINLRPDTYLWAYSYGSATSRPTTAAITEQPPRF